MRWSLGLVPLVGCFYEPAFSSDHQGVDAAGDGLASRSPTVHLIGNAYFSDPLADGVGSGSPGMTKTAFSISTSGVMNGDLLLFIANCDGGSDSVWPRPEAGFEPLHQRFFGNDSQTVFAAWKIASDEPATYGGVYGSGASTGAATISLVAVRGAREASPQSALDVQEGAGTSPPGSVANGLTVESDDSTLIYAAGADWQMQNDFAVFTPPDGFTTISALGDKGTVEFQWSTQQVAFARGHVAGATGSITGTISSDQGFEGLGFALLFAVAQM
jgi:hypothetical protein